MSRDDDAFDPSDWLTSQFEETGEVPKPKPKPDAPGEQAADEPDAGSPVAPPPAAQAGGFSWGLKPGGTPVAGPQQPAPPAEPTDVPTQAYTPPAEPADVPTQAYTPPVDPVDVPTQAYTPPELIPPADVPTQAMSRDEIAEAQQERARGSHAAVPAESSADLPTQAFTVPTWEPANTTNSEPPPAPISAGYPAAGAPLSVLPEPGIPLPGESLPAAPADPTSALDTLFSENKFEEYDEPGVLPSVAPLLPARTRADAPPVQRVPLTTVQKTVIWVAGALVAILALVALFLLGQRLGASSAATAPAPETTTGQSAAPKPATGSGPVAAGSHEWNQLNGGECIQPFTTAWAATFTVVDCGSDHAAQLLLKGTLPEASGAPYPSAAQFATEIKPLCTSSSVLNYDAARSITDLQASFTYPATAADWNSGDRTYYCFVTRASGQPLPASLAATK